MVEQCYGHRSSLRGRFRAGRLRVGIELGKVDCPAHVVVQKGVHIYVFNDVLYRP
jgi:hypothetical protein